MEKSRPTILKANYLYMLTALLFITIGGFFQFRNIYSGIFITEYLIILLPMILFVLFNRYDFKEVFKLKKLTVTQAFKSVLIAVFSYPIGLFFNYIVIIVLSLFGELRQTSLPVPETTLMLVVSLLLFAVTPGICEEAMFRGVMYSAYERIGERKAMILTGLMFGLFHLDIQNFLGPALLGMVFAYMVKKTGSIYSSVIAHTVNNSIAIFLLKLIGNQKMQFTEGILINQTKGLLLAFIPITLLASTSSVIVYFLIKSLSQKTENVPVLKEKITVSHIVPIIVVGILFVFSVISYFTVMTSV